MKRILIAVFLGLMVSVLTCGDVWAQATAQISGTVLDPSGAVLPGVEVTATQTDTGISRPTITNETGFYVLSSLPVGPYRLEATLPGFRTFVQTGIALQVNSRPTVNITLEVGQVSEQVEVQANAAQVEMRSVGVGQVIENERILELPLNGRNVTELISLSGAAVQVTVPSIADRIVPGFAAIVVAGGFNTAVTYYLDGVQHTDRYSNYNLPFPFPDALQEFKVETSALSAQSGVSSGGQVNAVTKSGTNEIHGTLFEFARNDLFNARNYFAERNSTLKRHQFGGMVGGPIIRNKLFFFGGIQRTTVRQDPADELDYVPTAAVLRGDFSAIMAPPCRPSRLQLRSPYNSSNQIDPALFSKFALNLSALLPKTDDPCGKVVHGLIIKSDENQYVGRVDYQWSPNVSVFARFLATKYDQPVPYLITKNILDARDGGQGYDNMAQSYGAGVTHLIGPNTVNSVRLAVNRSAVLRVPTTIPSASEIGAKMYGFLCCGGVTRGLRITVSGFFDLGATPGPNRATMYEVGDTFSMIRGAHEINIGANFGYMRANAYGAAAADGTWAVNGQVTGSPLADFMLGLHSNLSQTPYYPTLISSPYVATYVADTWRATQRLTINAGLRWEPSFPQTIRDGQVSVFSEERYKGNIRSKVFANAPAGFLYPGDSGFPDAKCRASGVCKAAVMSSQWFTLVPRLGFAWDPQGNGSLSIRSSYGIAYDVQAGAWFGSSQALPWTPALAGVYGTMDDPWRDFPGGNPFPVSAIDVNAKFPAYAHYPTISENAKPTRKHSWNLAIQKQFGTDWLASASYMGSHATHLWQNVEQNYAIYVPGNFAANGTCTYEGAVFTGGNPGTACSTTNNRDVRRRLTLQYPQITGTRVGFLSRYEPGGTQRYNGMILAVQRRAAGGLNIGSNYTWSHCYGNRGQLSRIQEGGSYPDPFNRDNARGNCEGDRRHILNLTAVASTPQFANTTLRALGSGWRLSSIYRRQSGNWLTVTAGGDRALSGMSGQLAHQVLVNPYGDRSSLDNYLNPLAFAQPALGTLGNLRPGNVEGPGTWQLDVALTRIFQVRETQSLEFRAEAFNLTNSLRREDPNTAINNSQFGRITAAKDPRIMQFAMKYVF